MKRKKGNLLMLNTLKTKKTDVPYSNPDTHYKQLCSELSFSQTIIDFTQRIHEIIKDLGLTDFIFMRMERNWNINSQRGLLYSLPKEMMRVYHEEKMHNFDLIIPYGKTNTQPIFSSQVYSYIDDAPFEIELTQKNRLLLLLNRRYDCHEHYVVPIPALNGNGHVQLLLTSTGIKKREFQCKVTPLMPICRSLCKAIDSVSTKKFNSSFIENKDDFKDNSVNITHQPLHLLNHLANTDISITELANLMCISPITAHQHIAAARKALGVKTNIGAITKAIKTGLIGID